VFVHNSIESFSAWRRASGERPGFVLTIGNFDGCHLGHQALIQAARGLACDADVCVLTFDPRPAVYFRKLNGLPQDEHAPASESLFDPQQKIEAMAELGVNHLILQPFDAAFSQVTADGFFQAISRDGCAGIVIGDDFRFGSGRSGDAAFLGKACQTAGISLRRVDPVTVHGVRASSSTIRREILNSGNVELASVLLGREYALDGEVERGNQNGRRIGIHTANLRSLDQIIPRNGVYAGYFSLLEPLVAGSVKPALLCRNELALPCVINVGHRPTVDASAKPRLTVEAHVIDHKFGDDALYGKRARIYFAARLRDETRFSSIEALKEQIHRDIETARKITS